MSPIRANVTHEHVAVAAVLVHDHRLSAAVEAVRKAARAHDAARMRERGISRAAVAQHFGVNVATVTRWMRKVRES